MRVLVIKFQTLGDVLLATPLINNLKLNYSDALIDVMVSEGNEPMMELNSSVNQVLVIARNKMRSLSIYQRLRSEFRILRDVRKKKYQIVISLERGDRAAIIAAISGSPVRVGRDGGKSILKKYAYRVVFHNKPCDHIINSNLKVQNALNIPVISKKLRLFWSADDDLFIRKKIGGVRAGFIHVHPFSREKYKENNINDIVTIIDYCEISLGITVVMTSSGSLREKEGINYIVNHCLSSPIDLSGQLSIKQVAALNNNAILFIGVDTAIMHISSANDVPVFAFFGPTYVNKWGPWDNERQEFLLSKKGSILSNGKHRVYCNEHYECIPCGKHGCNNSLISECLYNIDMSVVKRNIKEMVGP